MATQFPGGTFLYTVRTCDKLSSVRCNSDVPRYASQSRSINTIRFPLWGSILAVTVTVAASLEMNPDGLVVTEIGEAPTNRRGERRKAARVEVIISRCFIH